MDHGHSQNKSMGLEKKKPGRKQKGPSVFSKNLAVLMKERGLSIMQVARMIDVSPSIISGWSAGSQPADLNLVLKLCQATGMDFQAFLTGIHSSSGGAHRLADLFEMEDGLSGLFLIETKKLTPRVKK